MAIAYVLSATVRARLGSRATKLLDRDNDGVEDSGLLDDIIDEAGATIDARLTQRLATPFAAISDSTPTPDIIQRIALHLCLSEVYSWHEPDGRDATAAFNRADTFLNEILAGALDVPGASRQTGSKSRVVATYSAQGRVFSGTDSNGNELLSGV